VGGEYKIEDSKRPSSVFASRAQDSLHSGECALQHGRSAAFVGSLRSDTRRLKIDSRKHSRCSSIASQDDIRSRISHESLEMYAKPPEFALEHSFGKANLKDTKEVPRTPRAFEPPADAPAPHDTSPGPYDKPFKYDLLQGWLLRREWTNPFKGAKGRLAAIKREQAKLQRDKKRQIDQIVASMYGRDVTHTMDDAHHLQCLQKDFEKAAIEVGKTEDGIDGVRKERLEIQKLLIETKQQAQAMDEQLKQLRAERLAMADDKGRVAQVREVMAAESQKLESQLGVLEEERRGLQEERDALEATHTALSDARIQLEASLACQVKH